MIIKSKETYFNKKMPNENLRIHIFKIDTYYKGKQFKMHWHENMQLYFIKEGKAICQCNNNKILASKNSLIVINNNELHSIESLSDDLEFYTIRFDPSFIFNNEMDLCQSKYSLPIKENLILFENLIEKDEEILSYINELINEYSNQEIGYELALKANLLKLITLLLRNYANRLLTTKESIAQKKKLNQFTPIFNYIDENYNMNIKESDLSKMIHISNSHFCRTFKEITGKTPIQYINNIRLEKSLSLLYNNQLNITEIAISCGFDSINYYSRLFKKRYKISPSNYFK